jgi:hypothetical protein
MSIVLPEIIELNNHNGNIDEYEGVIHKCYLDIFRNPEIFFNGKQVLPIKYPIQHKGRHWTFSHMTSNGKIEDEREYDLRRCERVPWVKPILQNLNNPVLKIWKQRRNSKNRIAIWHEKENFMIVLEERGKIYVLVTTFITKAKKYKDQYLKEYSEYLKAVQSGKIKPI